MQNYSKYLSRTNILTNFCKERLNAEQPDLQGIKHVRFRLHHYRFTDEDFKRLFSQINTCMQHDLIPIIAFSAKPYKENPNAEEHKKVVEWWKMMAEKCKISHQWFRLI